MSHAAQNPLSLKQIRNPLLRGLIKKVSRVDVLERWYDDWLLDNSGQHGSSGAFLEYMLGRMNVDACGLDEELLNSVPKQGPLVIVANHPLGGLEGMLLTKVLQALRPDVKVLANDLLKLIPEFDDVFIGVDVLNQGKQRENARGMREAARHLSGGGALLVFPAGTVSLMKLPSFTLSDAEWSPMVARLARKYDAPIMPVFVEGRNSLAFYLSIYVHKRLRTLLLPRAMLSKGGASIPLRIGALIPAKEMQRLSDDTVATEYIRLCSNVLQTSAQEDEALEALELSAIKQNVADDVVIKHVESLSDCRIHTQKKISLYCVPYTRLGPVMEQLAIERERTFRQVDEGTGKELDTDRFDPNYKHLFLWDEDAQKIAGGYRIGRSDEIVEEHTLDGLYSHSLFDYDKQFLKEIGKSIEVGRSFITPEYQRHPSSLDMLWKGIGWFVMRNPEYHTVFGCVSISRQYSRLATALLSETLLSHYGAEEPHRRNIKARTPIDTPKTPWTKPQLAKLSNISVLNKLVGRIDSGKSIPILIRHYLALNGRFGSFTLNNNFGQSVDGLIIVDLRKTSDKYLKRYMGHDGFEELMAQWADPVLLSDQNS